MKIIDIMEQCLKLRLLIITLLIFISHDFVSFCKDVHEVEKKYRIGHSSLTFDSKTFHGAQDNGFKNRSPRAAMEQRQEGGAQGRCDVILNNATAFNFRELLADNSGINLVAFRLFNSSKNDSLTLQKVAACWTWASGLGQAILSVLDVSYHTKCLLLQPIATFSPLVTLTVAMRKFDVRLYENPNGCLGNMSTRERVFLISTILQQHLLSDQDTNDRLCYRVLPESEYAGTEFRCCKYKEKLKWTEMNNQLQCDTLPDMSGISVGISLAIVSLFVWSFLCLSEVTQPDEEQFIKTTENPLSLSSLVLKILWTSDGLCIVFFRTLFLCVVSIPMMYGLASGDRASTIVFALFVSVFGLTRLVTLVLFQNLDRAVEIVQPDVFANQTEFIGLEWWKPYNKSTLRLITWPISCLVLSVTCLLSPKHWQEKILSWYGEISAKVYRHRRLPKFTISFISAIVCVMKTICYVAGLLFLIICVLVSSFSASFSSRRLRRRLPFSADCLFKCLQMFRVASMSLVSVTVVFNMVYICTTVPGVVLGLLLNAEFYMPYITFCSVIILYAINFWSSVEKRYFSLKSNIYKVCKENFWHSVDRIMFLESKKEGSLRGDGYLNLDEVNDDLIVDDVNNMIVWKYDKDDVPVISRLLYDKIRERLLPYNFQLFFYAMKMLSVFVFAYFIFKVTHLLKPVDISPSIKVLLTLSASAVPYILNVFGERKSEDEKKADNEAQIKKIEKIILDLV